MDRATIQCPTVGMVTGVEYPVPRVNGTADQFRGAGGRMLLPAGGLAVWGRWSRLTGSGVPAVAPLIIPSPIGEGRLEAGVIRSKANRAGRSLGHDHCAAPAASSPSWKGALAVLAEI